MHRLPPNAGPCSQRPSMAYSGRASMVVGPSPRLSPVPRCRVAAKHAFDHKNGGSRSHRDTEMHENEIGTARIEPGVIGERAASAAPVTLRASG